MWGYYEQNSLRVVRDWIICGFSAKWLNGGYITKALPDYKGYKAGLHDDRAIVKDLWELFNEADILVAHNGDQFDVKKCNARFTVHGLPPPNTYKTVDTKKVAKSTFGFSSNKLNELGRQLGYGTKEQTGGYQLWIDCMAGKPEAWATMKKYNKRDVELLEKIYLHLRPWMKQHPNLSNFIEGTVCPKCGSAKGFQRRGFQYNATTKYRCFRCKNCGGQVRSRFNSQEIKPDLVNI